MSFKANDYQQITLTDSFLNLSPRTRRIVEKSWAKDFADIVFPAINEERFSVLYSSRKFSRPNTPVNVIVGALMLKELSGLTDDELFEAVCCDVRYQYALHTTHLEEQPISDRTFSRFRERLYNYHLETGTWLLDEEMKHLAKVYAEFMNLHSGIKRMDSLMVSSRCKDMSRLELLYTVVANAVKLLFRLGARELITADLRHYLEEDDLNRVIYHCKGEDASDRLSWVIADAVKLKELMSDDEWHGFPEYGLLIRVLREQTVTDESGETLARDKTEISPESLQNPSDLDVTFRRKAGKSHKGYVGNVVETVGENVEAAEAVNTKLITTALTGKLPDTFLAGFVFNEEGTRVLRCPMGHAPVKTTHYPKTGMCRVLFAKGCCDTCPHQGICKAKPQKKNGSITNFVGFRIPDIALAAHVKKL